MNAEVLRLLLAVSLIAMYVLAMLYLRRRRLGLGAYLFWGLFALSIPALGPFLVILTKPGKPTLRGWVTRRRALSWAHRRTESLTLSEAGFSDYLSNLEDYENHLARGEIQW